MKMDQKELKKLVKSYLYLNEEDRSELMKKVEELEEKYMWSLFEKMNEEDNEKVLYNNVENKNQIIKKQIEDFKMKKKKIEDQIRNFDDTDKACAEIVLHFLKGGNGTEIIHSIRIIPEERDIRDLVKERYPNVDMEEVEKRIEEIFDYFFYILLEV